MLLLVVGCRLLIVGRWLFCLLWKFAFVHTAAGQVFSGQIVGIYNEEKFMWNPTEFSTISMFNCLDAAVSLSQFSTTPGADNSVFSVSSEDITKIELVARAVEQVEY